MEAGVVVVVNGSLVGHNQAYLSCPPILWDTRSMVSVCMACAIVSTPALPHARPFTLARLWNDIRVLRFSPIFNDLASLFFFHTLVLRYRLLYGGHRDGQHQQRFQPLGVFERAFVGRCRLPLGDGRCRRFVGSVKRTCRAYCRATFCCGRTPTFFVAGITRILHGTLQSREAAFNCWGAVDVRISLGLMEHQRPKMLVRRRRVCFPVEKAARICGRGEEGRVVLQSEAQEVK